MSLGEFWPFIVAGLFVVGLIGGGWAAAALMDRWNI